MDEKRGWIRKVKLRGVGKVDWLFVFASAAFNLIRFAQTTSEARMTQKRCRRQTPSVAQYGHKIAPATRF